MKRDKEKAAITEFILKLLILFIPFLIMLGFYFKNDPFMVLKHYTRYDHSPILLNEGYVEWQMYMNNRDSIAFNSFIMGNSCTMAYPCREWEKYLDSGRAMRFFGTAESMMAIYYKLQALERVGAPIENVLMILDKESLKKYQLMTGYSNILPPAMSGINNFKFQEAFCQAFFYPKFLFSYIDYKVFHQYRHYMKGIINPYGAVRDSVTNDAINPRETMIKEEGEAYWKNQANMFKDKKDPYYRDGRYREAKPVIFGNQINLLWKIEKLLQKHHTSIKIIISPDYNQVSINRKDVEKLKRIFGAENIFDFSGINKYTADIHNYYECGHYRPVLGTRILKEVYCNSKQK